MKKSTIIIIVVVTLLAIWGVSGALVDYTVANLTL